VRSVQRQQRPPGQIVVVVDHNQELLHRLVDALPGVDVVANVEQPGLAGARNSGVARASGAVVAFLDDDATAESGWTLELLRHYADPAVLGVGGAVRPQWPQRRPRWLPPEFDWVVGCSYTGQPLTAAPVRNFIGANMSLRREVFGTVGGFSHALGRVGKHPAGCEETELCIRASQSFPGTELRHAPAAVVRHKVAPTRTRWSYFWRRCRGEGMSKSLVTQVAGAGPALASEREYVRAVLPHGVWAGLRAFVAGDPAGLARAGSIVLGLAVTLLGYLRGRMTAGWGSRG
jgi:GT2 family glycosyltransferase